MNLPPSPQPRPTYEESTPAMNTAAAAATITPGATKTTPNPACYTHPVGYSGAGSAKGQEPSHVLHFCLRGIAAFCWAALRRTLERMLFDYLRLTANLAWCSLIASLTAAGSRGGEPTSVSEAAAAAGPLVLCDKEGAIAHQADGPCSNSKKMSWSYLRGVYTRLFVAMLLSLSRVNE